MITALQLFGGLSSQLLTVLLIVVVLSVAVCLLFVVQVVLGQVILALGQQVRMT